MTRSSYALWLSASSLLVLGLGCGDERDVVDRDPVPLTPGPVISDPGIEGPSDVDARGPAAPAGEGPTSGSMRRLDVELVGKSGSDLTGTAWFSAAGDGVEVRIEVEGAPPGEHAVHIHEKADCSSPDAETAGGHFNPDGEAHGLPIDSEHHLGDLGNMTVAEDGRGTLERTVPEASLDPGAAKSFVGRGVIVHHGRDQGVQPSGDAGSRIGCGEIREADLS